jgi:hypothetical protein
MTTPPIADDARGNRSVGRYKSGDRVAGADGCARVHAEEGYGSADDIRIVLGECGDDHRRAAWRCEKRPDLDVGK